LDLIITGVLWGEIRSEKQGFYVGYKQNHKWIMDHGPWTMEALLYKNVIDIKELSSHLSLDARRASLRRFK
jgi:hypothetical protein